MKFVCLLLFVAVAMAAMANAQNAKPKFDFTPKDNSQFMPQVSGSGGGSRKQGFDVNLDLQQRVWESKNGRHSVDVGAGFSQHLGGPYGNSPVQRRGGVGYTYKFG